MVPVSARSVCVRRPLCLNSGWRPSPIFERGRAGQDLTVRFGKSVGKVYSSGYPVAGGSWFSLFYTQIYSDLVRWVNFIRRLSSGAGFFPGTCKAVEWAGPARQRFGKRGGLRQVCFLLFRFISCGQAVLAAGKIHLSERYSTGCPMTTAVIGVKKIKPNAQGSAPAPVKASTFSVEFQFYQGPNVH